MKHETSCYRKRGEKFMPEMRLRQPELTYNASVQLSKNKERTQSLKETGALRYIYQNEYDKACFQIKMAYGDSNDFPRKAASDKVLRVKHLILPKIQNMLSFKMASFNGI